MITPLALLKLLNLASQSLPIGAYSYSQGLEWAIEKGGIDTPEAIENWIHYLLIESIGHTDIPAMKRLYSTFESGDFEGFRYWNQWILACRETQELMDEDREVGKALLRLLKKQGTTHQYFADNPHASLITAWSFASHHWQIPLHSAAIGYCWSWVENQIAVACKILPLGQSPAQAILSSLMPFIEDTVKTGLSLADEDTGQSLPGWVMACAKHETQYSRMFRS